MVTKERNPSLRSLRSLVKRLSKFYADSGRSFPWRESTADNYARIVSEVLLQQTRAETVSAIFDSFILRYPNWETLSKARINELQNFIKPLGLWRRRSFALKALAQEITRSEKLPSERAQIEALPAVGQYVANAIELFCFERPRPLLDVNFARVLERYYGPRSHSDIRHDPFLQKTAQRIVEIGNPKKTNWSILDLGAKVCTARNPNCQACPLRRGCKYAHYRIGA